MYDALYAFCQRKTRHSVSAPSHRPHRSSRSRGPGGFDHAAIHERAAGSRGPHGERCAWT